MPSRQLFATTRGWRCNNPTELATMTESENTELTQKAATVGHATALRHRTEKAATEQGDNK